MTTATDCFEVSETLTGGETAHARPSGPAPAYGLRARAARLVIDRMLRRMPVEVELADGSTMGGPGPRLRVDRPEAFFARLGASPMIGLGEGYRAGDWGAADSTDLADALTPFAERVTDLVPPLLYRMRHLV